MSTNAKKLMMRKPSGGGGFQTLWVMQNSYKLEIIDISNPNSMTQIRYDSNNTDNNYLFKVVWNNDLQRMYGMHNSRFSDWSGGDKADENYITTVTGQSPGWVMAVDGINGQAIVSDDIQIASSGKRKVINIDSNGNFTGLTGNINLTGSGSYGALSNITAIPDGYASGTTELLWGTGAADTWVQFRVTYSPSFSVVRSGNNAFGLLPSAGAYDATNDYFYGYSSQGQMYIKGPLFGSGWSTLDTHSDGPRHPFAEGDGGGMVFPSDFSYVLFMNGDDYKIYCTPLNPATPAFDEANQSTLTHPYNTNFTSGISDYAKMMRIDETTQLAYVVLYKSSGVNVIRTIDVSDPTNISWTGNEYTLAGSSVTDIELAM